MESVSTISVGCENQAAWNQAFARLQHYINTFELSDQIVASRLALTLIDQARESPLPDSSYHPTAVVMDQTHQLLCNWLAKNLRQQDRAFSQIYSSGCMALYLSRIPETLPNLFLQKPIPDVLRKSMQDMLLITGPDLQVSSMTPRHIDYGPMLNLATHTWHRWNLQGIVTAMFFWVGVYLIFYWMLVDRL